MWINLQSPTYLLATLKISEPLEIHKLEKTKYGWECGLLLNEIFWKLLRALFISLVWNYENDCWEGFLPDNNMNHVLIKECKSL